MKHWITRFALLALLTVNTAHAGYDEGLAAYKNGDYATALREWRPLANQGYANAQTNLGWMYANGRGVTKDEAEAVRWYQKAADQGHANAQTNLGWMYAKGQGVTKDEAEAVRWYQKAADQGYAKAQFNLGNMYANGRGVTKDEAEAVRWHQKAADQGNAMAQYSLGWMYANGQGVTKNEAEAVRWYQKAADQGNAKAQANLGVSYANGQGVTKNAAEAVRWYQMAYRNPEATPEVKALTETQLAQLGAPLSASVAATPQQPARQPTQPPTPQPPAPADVAAPVLSFESGTHIVLTQPNFILKGQARDESAVAEMRLDGQLIAVSKAGTFSVKRFFAVGETVLTFAATDLHGNTANATVTVVRQAAATQTAAANDPALIPPETKAKTNPHALALIVGIEDYGRTFKAQHAARDANLFYDYAQRTLGIPAGNIRLLTGEKATRADLLKTVKTWMAPMIQPGKSQVVVFFAGHGLASSDGEKAFLIPHDGDPDMIEDTALDRQRLMADIARARPQSALFFFDTCYSGGARGGDKTLVANARAITIKPRADLLPPGFMQFSAAGNDQFAHSHPSQPHGLFSYYLMRGLAGEADANHDNRLTAGELQHFVHERVQRLAQTSGRPQVPELIGDPERVIAVWQR